MKRSCLRFVTGTIVALGVLGGGWLLSVAGLAGRPHMHNQWVEQAYAKKQAAAARTQGPRILLVAGSSAMFGVDSKSLGERLGRPVINLAVNAGVLAPFIIDHAVRVLRPGDWVVLPLEYPLYHDEATINRQFIDFQASHPLPVGEIGFVRWLKTMWLLPLDRVVEGYRGLPAGFRVTGLYGPQNLDERGDQRNSERVLRTDAMREAVTRSPPERYGAQARTSNASWSRWRRFARQVEADGGCALFVPPAMLARPTYRSDPQERDYYRRLPELARTHGLHYGGDPFDFMYEEDAFFDTNFHLTSEMRSVHTHRLADVLLPMIERHCRAPGAVARR